MKISAKGRYALLATSYMAHIGGSVSVNTISEKLGISKIYLEQVFSLLRGAGIVSSTKGAGGGYTLTRDASNITALDILRPTSPTLFDGGAASQDQPGMAVDTLVVQALSESVISTLSKVTVADISKLGFPDASGSPIMYYI